MEDIIPGVRARLDKKLSTLSTVIAQVVKEPSAQQSAPEQLDVELQQLLKESAQRILEYRREIEYKKQKADFQPKLQALQAEHEAQRQAVQSQLAASQHEAEQLRSRVADLEASQASLQQASHQLEERCAQAEAALGTCRQDQGAQLANLQQQVEALQAREARLTAGAEEEARQHAAEVEQLQGALLSAQRDAQAQREAHSQSEVSWQQESQLLLTSHAEQAEAVQQQLQQLQGELSARAATLDSVQQKLAAAEQQGARQAEELGVAAQRQQELELDLQTARAQVEAASAQLECVQQECTAARNNVSNLKRELGEARAAMAVTEERLSQSVAAASSDREAWEQQKMQDSAALQSRDSELAALQGRLQQVQSAAHQQVEGLEAELAACKEHLDQLEAKLGQREEELQQVQHQAEADQAAAADERARWEAERAQLQRELAAEQQAVSRATKEWQDGKSQLESQLAQDRLAHTGELQQRDAEHRAKLTELEGKLANTTQEQMRQVQQLQDSQAEELAAMRIRHAHQLKAQLARFDQHAEALSGAMQRMSDLLHQAPDSRLTAADGPSPLFVTPAGDTVDLKEVIDAEMEGALRVAAPAAGSDGNAGSSGSGSCESPGSSSPFAQLLGAAPAVPLSLQVVHAVLQQLYATAVDLHEQRGQLIKQVSDLHAAAEAARLHYEQEIARWERRLADQARALDKEGSVKRMEAVAAERREAAERLQEVEGRLQGELNQARHALDAALEEVSALSGRCARFDQDVADVKEQHAAELEAARETDAGNVSKLREQHAQQLQATIEAAGEEKARAEALLKGIMKRELQALAEQHAAATASLEAQHAAALAEAAAKQKQEEQTHQQVLESTIRTWKEKEEIARKQHQEARAQLQAEHTQAVSELQQQHAEEASRLQRRIALLDKSGKELLVVKAELEGQVAELQAEIVELQERLQQIDAEHQDQLGSAAEEHRRAEEAVRAELQGHIQSLETEKDALREQVAQLEQRLVSESRPKDLKRIAALERSLSEVQAQLASVEARYQRLRQEMLLREDNYNRTFANGGAGVRNLGLDKVMGAQQGVVDWMLKKGSPGSPSGLRGHSGDGGSIGAVRAIGAGRVPSPTTLLPNLKAGKR